MKIMYTDTDHKDLGIERKVFADAGMEFTIAQCKTEDEVIEKCQGAVILINQYAPITEKVCENLPDFRMVVRYGVGVDNIDVKACLDHGVTVCNVPDYGTGDVADHTLALTMALTRKIPHMNDYTKHTGWDCTESFPITRMSELTVGILGYGRIGKAYAQRVHGMGCTIISCDHHLDPGETAQCGYVTGVTLEELIERSDIISIHVPPIKGKYIFDADAIARMKDGVYIVNCARGGIIDEEALDRALESGHVAGAALDCTKLEPMPLDSKIFRHENLLCTPHMAWYSIEAAADLKRKVAEQAVKFAKTGAVDYPVFKN